MLFDTDGTFDVHRLAQVMRHLLSQTSSPHQQPGEQQPSDTDEPSLIDSRVLGALRHVHIFQPQSLDSLVATIQALPTYLFDSTQHHSGGRALDLIAIDSVTAFFWQEKMAGEEARWGESSQEAQNGTRRPERPSPYAVLAQELRSVQRQFECPVITTSWGLSPVAGTQSHGLGGGARPSFRPRLPLAWQNFVTLRLGVGRESVKKFAPGMTLEQAERDREAREKAVQEGRFTCWVDLWGVDGGGSGARKGGEFQFMIRDEGLDFDGT